MTNIGSPPPAGLRPADSSDGGGETEPRAPARRLRVVVGEDSYLVRQGIVRALEETGRLEVVAACGDYGSLLVIVHRTNPDVVVTDIRMPPTGTDEGLRIATELATSRPEIGVVVLSHHATLTYARAVFAGGNPRRAYILKDRVADNSFLLDAIESVARERPMLDPKVAGLVFGPEVSPGAGLDGLTQREAQVLALMAGGASNAAIARSLQLPTRAVERHINSIFTKLGLDDDSSVNRRVLAALAYERGTH